MDMIFDTHAHYDDEAFDEDREELIKKLYEGNIKKIVNIGADLDSSKRSADLALKYDFIYAAVGVHPDDASQINDEGLETLKKLTGNPKVKAIGEIGLDYYWNKDNSKEQKEAFIRQIELAKEVDLPIVVHSREAAKDTMDILESVNIKEIGGVLHCFSYSPEIALKACGLGLYIGIGGVVTFKNAKKLKETVKILPLEKIVLETDSPYLAPDPLRGKRNCSLYLEYVVKTIAALKGIEEKEIMRKTYENACRLYRL